MAWNIPTDHRSGKAVSRVFEGHGPKKDALTPTPLPECPWQKLGSDLFTLKGVTYLLVVDYFPRYPEVIQLKSLTSESVIIVMKSLFCRHGIPECYSWITVHCMSERILLSFLLSMVSHIPQAALSVPKAMVM